MHESHHPRRTSARWRARAPRRSLSTIVMVATISLGGVAFALLCVFVVVLAGSTGVTR